MLQPIVDYPVDVFDQVIAVNVRGVWLGLKYAIIAVNVRGVWLGLKYAIPAMRARGGGSIIITSSTAGIRGSVGLSAYTTSKHAVIGLMRCAALECAPWGIRVNTVNPAPIETRMMRSLEEMRTTVAETAVTVAQTKEAFAARIPLKRYGNPEEVGTSDAVPGERRKQLLYRRCLYGGWWPAPPDEMLLVAAPLKRAISRAAVYVPGPAKERPGNLFTVLYTPVAVSCIIPSQPQRIGTPVGGRSDE